MALDVSIPRRLDFHKIHEDHNVAQAFKRDITKQYYDGQAVTIINATGLVSPVAVAADQVFAVSVEEVDANVDEEKTLTVKQPNDGDTFKLHTNFKLTDAHIGDFFGIILDTTDGLGYVVTTGATTGQPAQFRLISILGKEPNDPSDTKYIGEFEFRKEHRVA